MIKKKLILLICIFFVTGCGFTPIYVEKDNNNFSIIALNFTGDNDLNNFLKTNLNKYRNENSANKIIIETKSEYEKNILTKNSAGKITNYELKAIITFTIKSNGEKIKLIEEKIFESMDDKFKEARYERSTKQNFAYSITNKFISILITK